MFFQNNNLNKNNKLVNQVNNKNDSIKLTESFFKELLPLI